MSIEWPKLGISEAELKNNNFNPELEKFLEDNIITQEETKVLHDIFSEKRANIYHVSKENLNQLRDIIWSKSKKTWITDSDMSFLKNNTTWKSNQAIISNEVKIEEIQEVNAKQTEIKKDMIKETKENKTDKLLEKLKNNQNSINWPITLGKSLTKDELIILQTIWKENGNYRWRIDWITWKQSYRAYKKIMWIEPQRNERSNKNTENNKSNIEVNSNDLKDFAAMVKAESQWESKEGQIAVAYTIINRMKEGNKTMNQVLYKKTSRWRSEFSPVDDWRLNKMKKWLNNTDIQLVKDVLAAKLPNPIKNATFFQSVTYERKANTWQERAEKAWKLKRVATIWNHIFRAIA